MQRLLQLQDGAGLSRAFATDLAHSSGSPVASFNRKAIIYAPARAVAQSGLGNTTAGTGPGWRIDFEQMVRFHG